MNAAATQPGSYKKIESIPLNPSPPRQRPLHCTLQSILSPARDKDSESRVQALSRGRIVSDKSHLSEWIGKGEGSTTKSNFREQDNNGVLSLKT